MKNKPLFIAEVKTESPFGFQSNRSWDELCKIAILHGDMIAVHTDDRWGGSFARIRDAQKMMDRETIHPRHKLSRKLIIAKGVHAKDNEILLALDCGAHLVTVVGRIPPPHLQPICIWEPSSFDDLVAQKNVHERILWNQRDLITGKERIETFDRARSVARRAWLIQASFIKTQKDVIPCANAFIVGEHLPSFIEDKI